MNASAEFGKLFERDLKRLKEEVSQYENEDDLWIKSGEISNSAGNLAMHLCGNLQHFIGSVLAGSGYKRDRQFEFGGIISKDEILKEIDITLATVMRFFRSTDEKVFEEAYPLEVFGYSMSTFYFIIHLQGHLNYHLGQVNYHRRILAK